MAKEVMNQIVEQLSALADEVSDIHNSTLTIDFSVDTYNLIASLYEEQNRIANALERIALKLESK